ncbi:hypothetical protein, partial [Flagellimonas marinaquae]
AGGIAMGIEGLEMGVFVRGGGGGTKPLLVVVEGGGVRAPSGGGGTKPCCRFLPKDCPIPGRGGGGGGRRGGGGTIVPYKMHRYVKIDGVE